MADMLARMGRQFWQEKSRSKNQLGHKRSVEEHTVNGLFLKG